MSTFGGLSCSDFMGCMDTVQDFLFSSLVCSLLRYLDSGSGQQVWLRAQGTGFLADEVVPLRKLILSRDAGRRVLRI